MNRTTLRKSLFLAIITLLTTSLSYAVYAAMVPTEQPTAITPDKATEVTAPTVITPTQQPITSVVTPVEPSKPEETTQATMPQQEPITQPATTSDVQPNMPDATKTVEPTVPSTNGTAQEQVDKAKQAEREAAELLERSLAVQKQKELAKQEILRDVQETQKKQEQEAKAKADQALVEKALHEADAKEKAEQEKIEREKNKAVSGICAVSVGPRSDDYANNTKVALANKIVIKKFNPGDKRSNGFRPLSVTTMINLNKTIALLGYEGFCKSPWTSKSPLAAVVQAQTDAQVPSTYYRSFERLLMDDINKRGTNVNGLTYLSIGSGNLYEDFIILNRLLQHGKTIKKVVIIDPTYQELIGELTPKTSQTVASWKNHIALTQLFTWFASAQKHVDFSVEVYRDVNSYRHDTSKVFPKTTPDIMVHCCANNAERPNIEKYDIQGSIGSYWLSPSMQLEGMKEFVGVCINHKKTDYGCLYNLKTNPMAKASRMLKISKGETCLCNK